MRSNTREYEDIEDAVRRMLFHLRAHRGTLNGARVERLIESARISASGTKNDSRVRDEAFDTLELMLERYQWTARATYLGRGPLRIFYIASVRQTGLSPDDAWEHLAASIVLRAVNEPGLLQRVKNCENEQCEHPIFLAAPNKPNQRFCNKACRLQAYAADPVMVANHRALVRRLRSDEKAKAEAQKRQLALEIANARRGEFRKRKK